MIERAEDAAIEAAMNSAMWYNIPITSGGNVSIEVPDKKLTLEDIDLIEDFVAILRKKVKLDQKLLPAHKVHGKKDSDSMVDDPPSNIATPIQDIGVGRIQLQNFCRRHWELLLDTFEKDHPKPWLSDSFKKFSNIAKDEGLYSKEVIYKDIMNTCEKIYYKLKEIEQ